MIYAVAKFKSGGVDSSTFLDGFPIESADLTDAVDFMKAYAGVDKGFVAYAQQAVADLRDKQITEAEFFRRLDAHYDSLMAILRTQDERGELARGSPVESGTR